MIVTSARIPVGTATMAAVTVAMGMAGPPAVTTMATEAVETRVTTGTTDALQASAFSQTGNRLLHPLGAKRNSLHCQRGLDTSQAPQNHRGIHIPQVANPKNPAR